MPWYLYPLTGFALGAATAISSLWSAGADEISLFDSRGSPIAYINTEDELTIYLWSGRPVAYLDGRDARAFHVRGFNGKHLGWFEKAGMTASQCEHT